MYKKLELRMFGLVPYNLSPIQMGIQYSHGVVEYGQTAKYCGDPQLLDQYNDWADNWKTFIILNGGTTNSNINSLGSLNQHLKTLEQMGVDLASFHEPDLGDQLTSVVFIVDERVFNRKDYPDFEDWLIENYNDMVNSDAAIKFNMTNSTNPHKLAKIIRQSDSLVDKSIYKKWSDLIGGEKNIFLKEFLHPRNFQMA